MPAATQLLNVQRGTNEVALDLSAQQASTLRGKSGLRVVTDASANLFNIDINTDPKISPVVANKDIQTAIRYALDYQSFVKLSGPGAVQAPGMIPTRFLGHLPPSAAVKRSLPKARAAVQRSGIQDPKITLTYPSELTVNGVSFATLAQKTKANLEEVGIEVELVGKPVNAFLETYAAGKHEMSQSYWGPDYPDPNDYLVFTPGGLAANRVNWGAGDDKPLAALAKRAERTVNDARRAGLFRTIGRIMNGGRRSTRCSSRHRRSCRAATSRTPPSASSGRSTSGRLEPGNTAAIEPGRPRSRAPWPFLRFLGRRLAALVVLALGITLIAFVLTQLVPGDPALSALGPVTSADPEAVAAYHERWGMDEPLPVQYLTYLGNLLQGDLGVSQLSHQPVLTDLREVIPATAELAFLAIAFAILVGVPLGVVAAIRQNKATDHTLRVVSLAGISMPTFWLALVALYVFFFRLAWFPGGGRLEPGVLPPDQVTGMYTIDAVLQGQWSVARDALHHLILPALVLAAFNVSLIMRYTRSAMLEVLNDDYVRAARAKGLPERTVVRRHVLRAALPSIVTVLGLVFANVLTGAVLVENIFSWPGVGQYAYQASIELDLPAIMGVSLFVAIVYVTVNFIVDVLYGVIDPRLRLQ